MLSFNLIAAALLLFSATTYAQSTNGSSPVWAMVLTTPEQEIAGLTACQPTPGGWFVNGGVDISVLDGFSPKTACSHTLVDNVADLFTPSGKAPLLDCYPNNSTCDFKLQGQSFYNATADYSRVGFQTGLSPGADGSVPDTSTLTFRTFEGADCASDANHSWHQWSCNTFIGDCSVLPYSVRSFSISTTPEENKTECYVASERGLNKTPYDEEGEGARAAPGSAVVALAAALGIALYHGVAVPRPHDIAHAVRHKDRRGHETLLRVARYIRHPYRDYKTHHRAEGPDDAVSRHGRHGAQYENETERAERELEENRLQRRPAERANNQRPETRHRAVDGVCARHHEEDEPRLSAPQPLGSNDLLLRGQKPGRRGAARDEKTPYPKQNSEASSEEVNVLPPLQRPPSNLTKPVINRPANDSEEPRTRKPPRLPQRLLLLRVVPRDDGHECGGDDGLDEAEEEALDEEAAEGGHGRGEHAD
ncbi:hypothetical protein V494_08536 [Pseudogymnoascus sp. VKM F-4513 (FW-928)]|nr:hypothetical protein V494_08536 [Pseudogymnoascus sp. VKM F-4513 (FW-928)]